MTGPTPAEVLDAWGPRKGSFSSLHERWGDLTLDSLRCLLVHGQREAGGDQWGGMSASEWDKERDLADAWYAREAARTPYPPFRRESVLWGYDRGAFLEDLAGEMGQMEHLQGPELEKWPNYTQPSGIGTAAASRTLARWRREWGSPTGPGTCGGWA